MRVLKRTSLVAALFGSVPGKHQRCWRLPSKLVNNEAMSIWDGELPRIYENEKAGENEKPGLDSAIRRLDWCWG